MSANVMPGPRSAELNGLNWQVHVDPLTLSITRLPPTLPEFAAPAGFPDVVAAVAPDDVLDELPPQAVTSTHAAPKRMTHLNCFIDVLRSPFDDRQLATGSECVRLAARAAQRIDVSPAATRPRASSGHGRVGL